MLKSDFRLTFGKSESSLEGFVGFVNCFGTLGEEGFFLVVEVELHNFLHTVAADDSGNADAEVALAVFALKQAGAGDELLLVAEHSRRTHEEMTASPLPKLYHERGRDNVVLDLTKDR